MKRESQLQQASPHSSGLYCSSVHRKKGISHKFLSHIMAMAENQIKEPHGKKSPCLEISEFLLRRLSLHLKLCDNEMSYTTWTHTHWMVGVGRDLCGSSSPTPPAEAGSPTAGCTGPCPGRSWISPEKETPQPPWVACSSALSPSEW